MPVIKPRSNVQPNEDLPNLFLAGSIEMGKAEEWQNRVCEELSDFANVYNPRRDDWDSSWTDDNPELTWQIKWEQYNLITCEYTLFYFSPGTLSPITLLELGQELERKKFVLVVCPDGYERQKNVEITCAIHGVSITKDLDQAVRDIKAYFKKGLGL